MLFDQSALIVLATYLATYASAQSLITEVKNKGGKKCHKVKCRVPDFIPNIPNCGQYALDTTYYDLTSVQINRLNNADLSLGGGVVLAGNIYIEAGSVWQIGKGRGGNYHGIFSGFGLGAGVSVGGGFLGGIGNLVAGIGASFGISFGGNRKPVNSCNNACKCKFALNYSQLLFPTIDVYQAHRGNCADKVIYAKWRKCYQDLVTACGGRY